MPSAVTISIIASLAILGTAGYVAWSKVSGGDKKRRGYTGAYDPKTGLGRGAPGFQTSVSRIAVPAHIIARIRAGEQVSAEEITAAQEEEARRQEREASGKKVKPRKDKPVSSNPANEWIPEGHGGAGSGQGSPRNAAARRRK